MMRKKQLLLIIAFLLLLYPLFKGFEAASLIFNNSSSGEVTAGITGFQLSIWICWLFLVSFAVLYKWTEKNNLFFWFTYAFLLVGFGIYGFFTQQAVNLYDLPTRFEDSYSLGFFTAIQQVLIGGILTFFLQFSVRIFETKWHRK